MLAAALTEQQKDLVNALLMLLGTSLALMLAGYLAYQWLRRRQKQGDAPPQGFGLAELRQMRDRAQITPQEYERARSKMLSRLRARAEPDRSRADPEAPGRLGPGPPARDGAADRPSDPTVEPPPEGPPDGLMDRSADSASEPPGPRGP